MPRDTRHPTRIVTRYRQDKGDGQLVGRVLVIARDASWIDALCPILHSDGYQTEIAGGAPEALTKLESVRFDGLVLGWGDEGPDKFALMRRVREIAPNTLALVVAAAGRQDVVLEALGAGADDVLVEPVSAAALRASFGRSEHWRSQVTALRVRNAELESLAALADLDRIKEDFIVTAGHDLKGPLTSIRGHSQLLLRGLRSPEPDLARLARGLAVIDAQAVAMTRLLDYLLDASRVQAGQLALRPAPCDAGECLATVLASLSPEESDRVDVTLDDAPLAGVWDRLRVEEVLANLVRNALKYSAPTARVTVRVERQANAVAVSVRDAGMGIPPEELAHLFTRFRRTSQAHASGLTGTGLGLYICRGIIEAHAGQIWAESPGEGRGSTFRFTLPTTAADRIPGNHDSFLMRG